MALIVLLEMIMDYYAMSDAAIESEIGKLSVDLGRRREKLAALEHSSVY